MPGNFKPTPAPRFSPWGAPDYTDQVAPGIWLVGTPSHGGFILSQERVELIPEEHLVASFNGQGRNGFFEEDCDWSIVAANFPEEFRSWQARLGRDGDEQLARALDFFNSYFQAKEAA